jgi:hypothetical protein
VEQRVVLHLLLWKRYSYDGVARALSLDHTVVRTLAHAAFDAIAPQTTVRLARRELIADYLLGQLPAEASEEMVRFLAKSGPELAWSRALCSQLEPLASKPLPPIS